MIQSERGIELRLEDIGLRIRGDELRMVIEVLPEHVATIFPIASAE
ncbi:MAG: hypothetical protein JWM95_2754 [Gemmatimonadetes bacterium]|nr:hypothetical protein [Gemmatimonadota bacterium]